MGIQGPEKGLLLSLWVGGERRVATCSMQGSLATSPPCLEMRYECVLISVKGGICAVKKLERWVQET